MLFFLVNTVFMSKKRVKETTIIYHAVQKKKRREKERDRGKERKRERDNLEPSYNLSYKPTKNVSLLDKLISKRII